MDSSWPYLLAMEVSVHDGLIASVIIEKITSFWYETFFISILVINDNEVFFST